MRNLIMIYLRVSIYYTGDVVFAGTRGFVHTFAVCGGYNGADVRRWNGADCPVSNTTQATLLIELALLVKECSSASSSGSL